MGLYSDSKIIYHMAVRPVRGNDHAERMDNFYAGQAEAYDSFRKKLLLGRELLWEKLLDGEGLTSTASSGDMEAGTDEQNPASTLNGQGERGAVPEPEPGDMDGITKKNAGGELPQPGPRDLLWCDMGGGTGANLNFFGEKIRELRKVYVVDLAASLLSVAEQRIEDQGWENVEAVEADATTFVPDEGLVDVVTFSYSLTMIPDWFAAIDHAFRLLKPGGRIGVVDFYLSRKHPAQGHVRHSWCKRAFWPMWFNTDNVFPSPDHVPYLHRKFETLFFHEGLTRIPYFPNPFFKMPHYVYIGRKKA